MDREQLEALRRQVEEDYRLDIAAIERLQRRYPSAAGSVSTSSALNNSIPLGAYTPSQPSEWSNFGSGIDSSSPVTPSAAPSAAAPGGRRSDELEGSLRTMFNNGRK